MTTRSSWTAWLLFTVAALAACEEEEKRVPGQGVPCQPGAQSMTLRAAGTLSDSDFWTCSTPPAGAGSARFTSYEGISYMVSGGSTQFLLTWEGADSIQGRMIIVGIDHELGYYVLTAPSDANPMPVDIHIAPTASGGNKTLYFAIDDGTGTPEAPKVGSFLSIPLTIIKVGGGDVQVSLNWDTPTDVDLHVVDPSGEEIYWRDRRAASSGLLDLDSNPNCILDNRNNENIYWGPNMAPPGEYIVRVDYWSACDLAGSETLTNYRVTILLNGDPVHIVDDSFAPTQADNGGAGSGLEVARFTYQ